MSEKPYEIAVCSLFRDAITFKGQPNGTIPRIFRQLAAQSIPVARTYYCFLEGDSRDGTYQALQDWVRGHDNTCLLQRHTGVADEEGDRHRPSRFARLAGLGNQLLAVARSQARYVCWLEPDLVFGPDLFARLRDTLDSHPEYGAVAPFVRFGSGDLFYDTWGFRDPDGRRWSNRPPYSPRYREGAVLKMQSVGSCVMVRSSALDRGARMGDEALVSLCQQIRGLGAAVVADCRVEVQHPRNRKVGWKWML